jgi:hypothetical protein
VGVVDVVLDVPAEAVAEFAFADDTGAVIEGLNP